MTHNAAMLQSLHDFCVRLNELPVALAQAFDLKGDGRVSCWEFTRGLHNLQAGASGSKAWALHGCAMLLEQGCG